MRMKERNQWEISQAAPHYVCAHTLKNIQQFRSAAQSLVQVFAIGCFSDCWGIVTMRMRRGGSASESMRCDGRSA